MKKESLDMEYLSVSSSPVKLIGHEVQLARSASVRRHNEDVLRTLSRRQRRARWARRLRLLGRGRRRIKWGFGSWA